MNCLYAYHIFPNLKITIKKVIGCPKIRFDELIIKLSMDLYINIWRDAGRYLSCTNRCNQTPSK